MPSDAITSTICRVGSLSPGRSHQFDLAPARAELRAIAAELEVSELRKLRFVGTLSPEARADWRLDGHLGATVKQPCVVSLEPVTTRIEEDVVRRFLDDWPPVAERGEDVEMPEDETIDPLGDQIDLRAVLLEALSLALPPYPRAAAAQADHTHAAPPGAEPIRDADMRAFSALADLKRKLDGGDSE